MSTLLLAAALFSGLFGSIAAAPAPHYALCTVVWLFETPCAEISTRLVQQITAFDTRVGCAHCQYTLVAAVPLSIVANHTSDGHTESLAFILSPTTLKGGCRVSGVSSFGFTSHRDGGLNYCNLINLLSASGLTSAPGYKEMTDEWTCEGYQLATCKA